MLGYKNLLMLVDNTELDGIMLRYLCHYLDDSKSLKLTLLYFLPPDGDKAVLDFLQKGDDSLTESKLSGIYQERKEQILKELSLTVKNAIDSWRNIEVNVEVKSENNRSFILEEIKRRNPDLLIMGKKEISRGSGRKVKFITRNAAVDSLVIPSGTSYIHERKPIGFAIDFGDTADYLLQRIYNLTEDNRNLKFIGLHVLNMVPIDYTMYNVHQEILDNQKKELQAKFEELITKYDLTDKDVTIEFDTNLEHSVVHRIYQNAKEIGVGMIMIAPKKHSALGRFMLGSVTEGLFEVSADLPIYIIH